MRSSRIARRYARALFLMARRSNVVEGVGQDLLTVASFLEEYPQVMQHLVVPRTPPDRKKSALNALVGGRLTQDLSRRFLDLLVDHNRIVELPGAAAAYATMADEAHNIITVYVATAQPLDTDQSTRLKAKLDQLTGRDTKMETTINPALVGGLVVRIGDRILDGSVRGYLEQFGRVLRGAPLGQVTLDDVASSA